MKFTESIVEDAALAWFGELQFAVLHGPEISPGELAAERAGLGDAVLAERLRAALRKLNPALPTEAMDEAYRKVTIPQHPSLIANNRAFHRMLVDGITVECRRKDGSIGAEIVRLIDFEDPQANDWLAVNQFTVIEGQHNRRPDIVIFINGLPLGLTELKNAADEQADIWVAFNQIQTYKQQIRSLFVYNAVLIISDGIEARIGTISADKERFIPATNADVVILAGDTHVGTKGAAWALHQFPTTPIIYLMGNHEFYHYSLPALTGTIQRGTAGTHFHLLENSTVELNGYTFLGCTLWTDFSLASYLEVAMGLAESRMNDYRIITNSNEQRTLRARDTAKLHKESVAWLTDQLSKCDPERTIVVTHHAPSQRSEDPFYAGSPMSPAFASNMDAAIEKSGVPLWIHGHTHYNVDYKIGVTRVLSNQRGYPGEPCKLNFHFPGVHLPHSSPLKISHIVHAGCLAQFSRQLVYGSFSGRYPQPLTYCPRRNLSQSDRAATNSFAE